MNVLEQFKMDYLSKLESEDKDKILGAFDEVTSVFNETIQRRDGVSKTNREQTELIKSISAVLGVEELNEVTVKEALANNNADAEKLKETIKAQYDEKYSGDIQALTKERDEAVGSVEQINIKYNDSLFNNAVANSGLLDEFTPNSEIREKIVIPKIKEQLLFKDGKMYVKDSVTGDIAYKLGTQEPLQPSEAVSAIAKASSPDILAPSTQGNGGGMPPNQGKPAGGDNKPQPAKNVGDAIANGFASMTVKQ